MDPRKLQFLKAVVGADGAAALVKATSHSPDLEWAILPRVVMAWLEVASQADYDGTVPGVDDTRLAFRKAEEAFTGSIDIGDEVYSFRDATLFHVAGSVAVALGSDHEAAPPFRSPALAKLGKSIDLLVKSRTLRKAQAAHHGGARGVKLPGVAAAPIAPQGPAAPILKQPEVGPEDGAAGTPAGTKVKPAKAMSAAKPKAPGAAVAAPKLPGVKPKKPAVKVTKAEAATPCEACGVRHFSDGKYVGCACFRSLAKHTDTILIQDGFRLEFGKAWDQEAILTLMDSLKR